MILAGIAEAKPNSVFMIIEQYLAFITAPA